MIVLRCAATLGGDFEIEALDARHLLKVLRCKVGDSFEVVLPEGQYARARLLQNKPKALGRIEEWLPRRAAPPLPLWLAVAWIRPARLEWLVEKATELGVQRFTPLQCARTRAKVDIKLSLKINRLNKISQETLKQVGRPHPLQIDPPLSFESFLKSVATETPELQRVLLNPQIVQPLLQHTTLSADRPSLFAIGPEGDFSDEEIHQMEASGFQSVSLGPAVLRSETAALYAACYFSTLRRA